MKLNDVQVGTPVVHLGGFSNRLVTKTTVTRVTDTQFTTADGYRFTKRYGHAVGRDGHIVRGLNGDLLTHEEADERNRIINAEYAHDLAVYAVSSMSRREWARLSTERLNAIIQEVKEVTNVKPSS